MKQRYSLRIAGLAVALSLAFRAAYFLQVRASPWFDTPLMDEAYHDLWASEIAAGDLTGRAPFFRAPLYPFLLAGLYRLLGRHFAEIRAIQLAFGALSPFLVYLLARRLAPSRPAVAAVSALVVALDGLLPYFEADLLLEALLAPMSLLFCLLLLRAGERAAPGRWFVAGLALGLFAITRPNILLFAPVAFVLALGWRRERFSLRRPRLAAALALTAGTCLPLLPVTYANWRVGGDRVLVASQGGLNLFLGNNPEANGWSATAPSLFRNDWWGGIEDAVARAEEARGRQLKPSEVSAYWYGRALEWWGDDPGAALLLSLRKVVYFFSGVEFSNNRDIRLFVEKFAPVARPSLFLFYAIGPLALWGAFRFWRHGGMPGRSLVLFAGVYAATIVAFFVTARYRVPLRPLLVIFAIEGARGLGAGLRARSLRRAVPAVFVLLFAVAVNANPWILAYRPSKAQFYQTIARLRRERGDLEGAIEAQKRAVELDPTYPDGNLNLGSLYMATGDVPAAIEAFRRERRVDPDDGRNLASLGLALQRSGRLEEAERAYRDSERAGLVDARVFSNHALCLARLGRGEEAEEFYERALAVDSTLADAWNGLGAVKARAGLLGEAIRCWEKTLELRPRHPRALENLQRARRLLREPGRSKAKDSPGG